MMDYHNPIVAAFVSGMIYSGMARKSRLANKANEEKNLKEQLQAWEEEGGHLLKFNRKM